MLSFNITPAESFSLKQASASCGRDINAAIINIYVFWPCFLFSEHLKVIAAAEFISQGDKKNAIIRTLVGLIQVVYEVLMMNLNFDVFCA